MLAVSVFEEVFYRGVLFRVIEEGLGSWAALAITAALFGFPHLGNPNATLLGGLGVVLSGALFAVVYMLTRSLWVAIGLHWAWNFIQGAVFGMPVSGATPENSLIQATTSGPELWSGGAFGPEAGLVAYGVIAVVGVTMLALAVRRGHVVTPRWMRRGTGKKAARA